MLTLTKRVIKKILPISIHKKLSEIYFDIRLKQIPANHKRLLERLREKEKKKVLFLLVNVDSWKYDTLYWEFDKINRFELLVIVCPFIAKGHDYLEIELEKSIVFCNEKKYKYLIAYDTKTRSVIDIKKILKPDIVFFSNPNALTSKKLLISNFLDTLTCYVPYSFRIDTLYNYNYNNDLVNLTWINFYETPIHKELAAKYARNKGENVIVSGYPYLDNFRRHSQKSVWKSQPNKKKKIIWGPHWTIKGHQSTGLDWSCFLDYADFFLKAAENYKDELQLAMKPHPFLRNTLESSDLWGIEKTKDYFLKWQQMENCQLVEGDYVDLFIDSDALIHDSGSFMAEYLILNKPIAYTLNDRDLNKDLNEFGQLAISYHRIVRSEAELLEFIEDVITGKENFNQERTVFINNHLVFNDKMSANIITQEILNKLE